MKILFVIFFFMSLQSQAFQIDNHVTYIYRSLGVKQGIFIAERIVDIDEDFLAHQVEVHTDGYLTAQAWKFEKQYLSYTQVQNILNNCGYEPGTSFDNIIVNNVSYTTCRIEGFRYGSIIEGFEFDNNDNVVWVGHGPYNSIFKVVDYRNLKLYEIFNFY